MSSTPRIRTPRHSNPYVVGGCLALVGIFGSFAIWQLLDTHDRQLRRSEFIALARERAEAIQREFRDDVERLYSVSAFFQGSQDVSEDEFEVFTKWLLERHSSVLAFEWAPAIPHRQRQAFERRMSSADRYISISEIGNDRHLKTASRRERYYPVEYLNQHRQRKASVLGFDHASDPPRWEAMQQALDLGSPVASQRLDLFRIDGSADDRKGLLVAMPVLKQETMQGFVLGLFQISNVVQRALDGLANGGVEFAILDTAAPEQQQLLHSSIPHDSVNSWLDGNHEQSVSIPITIARREWKIVAAPSDAFYAERKSLTPLAVLISSLLATFALSIAAFVLLERSARIERLVDKRTAELQVANRLLQFSEEQEKLASEAARSRAAELARANEVLAEKNQELDEFTYVASHDLQEPIRKLVSFSHLLEQDLGDNLTEQVESDLKFIVDAAKRMRQLVQDLLALSRAGRSAMRIEPVNTSECVDRALEALDVRIEETNAEIIRDDLPIVMGDKTLLTQLFQNLIGNALKFVEVETPVIHLTAVREDDHWVLGVKDNGIGIKPEYLERIFQPFKRLHSRGEYSGTGIGLAICRKSVHRHEGEIFVESTVDEGSHFQFRLPRELAVSTSSSQVNSDLAVAPVC